MVEDGNIMPRLPYGLSKDQPDAMPVEGLRVHLCADGRITYRVDFLYRGSRYAEKLGACGEAAALQRLDAVRRYARDRATGFVSSAPPPAMMTTGEVVGRYMASYRLQMEKSRLSLTGWNTARKNLGRAQRALPALWAKPAGLLTPADGADLRDRLLPICPSVRTARSSLTDFRTAINHGIKALQVCHNNPITREVLDGLPEEEEHVVWELHPQDDSKLLKELAAEPWSVAAVLLALDLGLRVGSIIHIRPEDLDLKERVLLITVLKGKRRKRKVREWKPLTTRRLAEALARQVDMARIATSPWLFPGLPRKGGTGKCRKCDRPDCDARHLSPDLPLRRLKAAAARAKLSEPTTHSLRHIFNTRSALVLRPEVRRAISSHESEEMSDHYTHLNTRAGALSLRTEAVKLDVWLSDASRDSRPGSSWSVTENESAAAKS